MRTKQVNFYVISFRKSNRLFIAFAQLLVIIFVFLKIPVALVYLPGQIVDYVINFLKTSFIFWITAMDLHPHTSNITFPVPPNYEPADLTLISTLPDLVVNHTLNCCFAVVFGSFNIPLLITLASSKIFRQRYLVLIFLCLADSSNCLAIFLMGLNRVLLYSNVISTMTVPVRNQWYCATEPWIWLRGIGDLWPPIVQVVLRIFQSSFLKWWGGEIVDLSEKNMSCAIGKSGSDIKQNEKVVQTCWR